MKSEKMTMDDIREKYKKKTYPDLSLLFGYYRLEILLTNLFLKTGVSANVITGISFGAGLIGCVLLASGFYGIMLIGGGLLIFSAFLDYIDGNVARKTKTADEFGTLIDLLSGHIITGLSLISIGVGVSYGNSYLMIEQLFTLPSPEILGLAAALSYFIYRFVKAYCLQFGNGEVRGKEGRKSGFVSWISRFWSFVGLYTIITFISILFRILDIWFVLTVFLFIVDGIFSSFRVFYGAYKRRGCA